LALLVGVLVVPQTAHREARSMSKTSTQTDLLRRYEITDTAITSMTTPAIGDFKRPGGK
jgi:hypothetical protein